MVTVHYADTTDRDALATFWRPWAVRPPIALIWVDFAIRSVPLEAAPVTLR